MDSDIGWVGGWVGAGGWVGWALSSFVLEFWGKKCNFAKNPDKSIQHFLEGPNVNGRPSPCDLHDTGVLRTRHLVSVRLGVHVLAVCYALQTDGVDERVDEADTQLGVVVEGHLPVLYGKVGVFRHVPDLLHVLIVHQGKGVPRAYKTR